MAYEGGCTPLRDRNYYDLSVLLTNVAIDMIRTIHKENKDYQVFLDDFLTKLAKEDEKLLAQISRKKKDNMYK